MFAKSEIVQKGASIGEAIRSNSPRNFPKSCYEMYIFYRTCLNDLVVNSKARMRPSVLENISFDEYGNVIRINEPDVYSNE